MKPITYAQAVDEVIQVVERSGRADDAIKEYRLDVVVGYCYETVPRGGLVATANSDEFWRCVDRSRRSSYGGE